MKLLLDEEEVWILGCIKEAHNDCGFHIRDVIKKAKTEYGLCRSTVYEIVSYLEFHGLIKTNSFGNRELDPSISYLILCSDCGREIPGNEFTKENGRIICDDCYLKEHQKIKLRDLGAVPFRKRSVMDRRLVPTISNKFVELTELQKEIYKFIAAEGRVTLDKISKLFGMTPQETSNQLVVLGHCELVMCQKIEDEIYLSLFDP
ncbi:MAG TPA: hypothetical protein HA262_13590 [Methanosarcina sp.]|jgi:DNA-directed RNA polymerase subunit RPC12/RpoP|nr:hypothetical protein [Methanosarcina sp.]